MGSEKNPITREEAFRDTWQREVVAFGTFGNGVAGDRRRGAGSAGGSAVWACPAVRVQVGAPLPGRRPSRFGGSVVAAALLPHAHQPGSGRAGATSAADVASVGMRPADRRTLKPSPGPVVRYKRSRPGELLHMDVKKLSSIPPAGDGEYTAGATPPPGGRDGPLCTP